MASWVTGTYSHVDRLWSITPALYAVVYAAMSGGDPRCTLMATLACAWGTRLTYNFARKGGYSKGEQDYRWPVLQEHPLLANPVAWQIFNFGFIASYQHVLLLLIALPSAAAWRQRGTPSAALNAMDAVAAAAMTAFLALEATADQQQWAFQQSKHRAPGFVRQSHLRDDYTRGFLTQGLFRYSRHPNFFAEQCIWCSYYGFAVASKWWGGQLPSLSNEFSEADAMPFFFVFFFCPQPSTQAACAQAAAAATARRCRCVRTPYLCSDVSGRLQHCNLHRFFE